MSKIQRFLVKFSKVFILSMVLILPSRQSFSADVDPRLMVVGSLALYGTIGGALLGAASLAYNTKPRAIAMGASIGLYVGLLFGGYIVLSHHYIQTHQNVKGGNLNEGSNIPDDSSEDTGEPETEGDKPKSVDKSLKSEGDEMSLGINATTYSQEFFHKNIKLAATSKTLFYVPLIDYRF